MDDAGDFRFLEHPALRIRAAKKKTRDGFRVIPAWGRNPGRPLGAGFCIPPSSIGLSGQAHGLLGIFPMAKTWHYCVDGQTAEPVEEPTFVEHCRVGKITDTTMVWTAGMEGWQSYAEMHAAAVAVAEAAERKAAKERAEAEAAGQVQRQPCAKCGKDWPEALMVQPHGRWMCRPCYTRELDEARKKALQKAERPASLWTNPKFLAGIAAAGALGYFGSTTGYDYVKGYWDAPPTQAPEAWVEKPTGEWPQISLAADVQLRGSPQPWRITNACLLTDPHNHVLGVGFSRVFQSVANRPGSPPAAEPVTLAGGLHPAAKVSRPNPPPAPAAPAPDQMLRWVVTSLTEWRVGTAPASQTVFTKIHGLPVEYGKSEVLLLDAAQPLPPTAPLPATALRVRTIPVKKDQVVYVVGSNGGQTGAKQTVRTGTLHATFNAQKTLDLAMNSPIDPAAFVGAPVIDDGGHLLGIVNGTLDSPDRNGQIDSLSAEGVMSFAGPLELPPSVGASAEKKDVGKKKGDGPASK